MYLISFYVPETHLKEVTEALFNKGAGKIGNYDSCAWHTRGIGQFRPLKGSSPFLGIENKAEYVDELKVEIVCESHLLKDILKELINVHPYETPAYHAFEVLTLNDLL